MDGWGGYTRNGNVPIPVGLLWFDCTLRVQEIGMRDFVRKILLQF